MPKAKTIFITATDTGVGKTITAFVLSTLLKAQGKSVGIIKPVQCAGNDAKFLKAINPFYAPEPLSPHLALQRAKIKFDKQLVKRSLDELRSRHDFILIEGAGGLMVPITDNYYNADLIADLRSPIIIVSRLGLGTINHTLLTINEAKRRGITVLGLVFCQTRPGTKNIPESTNPKEIEKLSKVEVLGIIPYLKPLTAKNVLKRCQNLKLNI